MQNWDFFGTKFGLWSHLGPSPKFGTSIERLIRLPRRMSIKKWWRMMAATVNSFGEEEGVEVDGMLGDDTLARVNLDRAVEDALHEAECLDKTLSCGSWGR